MIFHKIGKDKRDRPGNPSHAVDEHIGFLEHFVDEVSAAIEVN